MIDFPLVETPIRLLKKVVLYEAFDETLHRYSVSCLTYDHSKKQFMIHGRQFKVSERKIP